MSETNSPVDEPPGKDGTQAPNPPDLKPVPDWGPGENPVGTNPPVTPAKDPATNPIPGSIPGVGPPAEAPPAPPSAAATTKHEPPKEQPKGKH